VRSSEPTLPHVGHCTPTCESVSQRSRARSRITPTRRRVSCSPSRRDRRGRAP
jgi:hypothetical protein